MLYFGFMLYLGPMFFLKKIASVYNCYCLMYIDKVVYPNNIDKYPIK